MRMSKARSAEIPYTIISITLACSIAPRELLISSTNSSTDSLTHAVERFGDVYVKTGTTDYFVVAAEDAVAHHDSPISSHHLCRRCDVYY